MWVAEGVDGWGGGGGLLRVLGDWGCGWLRCVGG